MKRVAALLAILFAVGLTGCGTNASKVEASVAAAQSNIKAISDKREDTKVTLANKQADAKKELVNVCANKTGIDMAVCMLGVVAVQAVGSNQVAAYEQPLPAMPVLTPQPGALERTTNKILDVAVALSPVAMRKIDVDGNVKIATINGHLQEKQAEFNFLEAQSRDQTVTGVVGVLAAKQPSINVTGDYLTNGSAKAGGDLAGHDLTKKNCTAGNAGQAAAGTTTGTGASAVTIPAQPGGYINFGC